MREWLVIESTWGRSLFSKAEAKACGYFPRDTAERLLAKDLSGTVWFTKDESAKMREHAEWRDTEPGWSPLGFWAR